MGKLYDKERDREVFLLSDNFVGRGQSCAILIDHGQVSRVHARIRWNEDHGRWALCDRDSTNGTWWRRGGQPEGEESFQHLPRETERFLSDGDEVWFGSPDAGVFRVEDVSPPRPFAVRVPEGSVEEGEVERLVLRGDPLGPVVIDRVRPGAWVLVSAAHVKPIRHKETIEAGGLWRLYLPDASQRTERIPLLLRNCTFVFTVADGGDAISLRLELDGRCVASLGTHSHWRMLWLLALEKQADAAKPPGDQGWRGRHLVAKAHGIEEKGIWTYTDRMRKHLDAVRAADKNAVIEKKKGKMRCGIPLDKISIIEERTDAEGGASAGERQASRPLGGRFESALVGPGRH